MQEGGSLVWESDADGERAWENLPIWARKQIIDKNIRVFTLPGFDIARKATDRADLQLRMQGNAFLGAFFAVSPMLQEFGITQEQFRDVVHKQYVKKFGKLGEAVVQSNMEVMMQGFEQVKEIKVGALTAADHSTLRGQALLPILELATRGRIAAARVAVRTPLPAGQGLAHRSTALRPSMRSSAPTTATISRPRRSRRWALLPPPPATRLPSTLRAAKRRSTLPRTARSAWSASRFARIRRCPTPRRIWARCCRPRSPTTWPMAWSATRCCAPCLRLKSKPARACWRTSRPERRCRRFCAKWRSRWTDSPRRRRNSSSPSWRRFPWPTRR